MLFGQPLLTTKLSGKLGGVVGATARGGVGYLRRRVDPSNPNTPAQALARSVMTALSGTWANTLTESQRNSWAAKANPEESGIDVYTRANFQQLMTGLAAATPTAPASVALGDTPITDVGTYDISDNEWTVTIPAGTARDYALYLSKPQAASRLSRQYPFTIVNGTDISPGTTVVAISSGNPWFGATAGQVGYARLVCFGSASPNLGRVGQEQIFRVSLVA